MPLNDPVLVHWMDLDLLMRLGTAAFVGIIGAGLIVFSKGRVKNLTTAAHLWLAAVIGIACGAGQWPLVVIGAVISVIMLTVLRVIERRWFPDEDYTP